MEDKHYLTYSYSIRYLKGLTLNKYKFKISFLGH